MEEPIRWILGAKAKPQFGSVKLEEPDLVQRSHYGRSLAEEHRYQATVTEDESIQDEPTHEMYAKGSAQREPKDNFTVRPHITTC